MRSVLRAIVLSTAISGVLIGSEARFTNFEAYLRPERRGGGYSLSKEVERFRSHAQLDRAYRLIQNRDLEGAGRELRSLLQAYPQYLRARTVYLEVLSRLGDRDRIIEEASAALKQNPHFVPALVFRGQAYAANGRVQDARKDFESLLRQPNLLPADRLSALEALGDLYLRSKQYPAALSAATELLDQRKGHRTWLLKGMALEALDRLREAENSYIEALTLASTSEQRLRALGAIAEVRRKQKQWTGARAAILNALQIAPQNVPLLRLLAQTEYQLKNFEAAAGHYRRILSIEQDPGDREFLANILLLQENWRGAEKQLRAMLSGQADGLSRARAYRSLSRIAEKQGDPGRSAVYLRQAVALEGSPADQERLAHLLIARGDFADGAAVLEKLIARARTPADRYQLLMKLGHARTGEGRYSESAKLFKEAAAIGDDAPAFTAASKAFEQAGDLESAIQYARRAVQQEPSPEAKLRLGALFEKAGEWDQALLSFEGALGQSADPLQQSTIHRQIGFVSLRREDYEKAHRAFELALTAAEDDLDLHRAAAETLTRLSRFPEATAHWKKVAALTGSESDLRALALSEERGGDLKAAISTYSKLLSFVGRPSREGESICAALASLEARSGNYGTAAGWWLKASDYGTEDRRKYLASAVQNLLLAERWEEAAQLFQRYAESRELPAPERAHAFESLAYASAKLGNDAVAAGYFRSAIETGSAAPATYEDLGFALTRLGRWREALEVFHASPRQPTTRAQIAAAQCYRELGKPGLAVHCLRRALTADGSLASHERRQAYADLGYLYAGEGSLEEAARAWEEAQRLEPSQALSLGLARLRRLTGDLDGAWELLEELDRDALTREQQAEYFDETAVLHAQMGKMTDSLKSWQAAAAIEPSARRSYEIGLIYFREGKAAEALPFLEKAQEEAGSRAYLHALAYAYKAARRLEEAVSSFNRLVQSGFGGSHVYTELGYLEMRRGRSASAAQWFRKALKADSADPGEHPVSGAQVRLEGLNLREDLARLTNRWDFALYQGYAQNGSIAGAAAPGTSAHSVVPQGGGFEVAFQPPRIGFRNERTFHVVARALWNNEPGSIRIEDRSALAGLGVRYKPLASQNVQVSFERLIPLAGGMQQVWMARAMSSWSRGFEVKRSREAWNYSLLFIDGAFFFGSPRSAAQYMQVRQGVTLRAGQFLLVTPHAAAIARHQSPGAAAGSYLEQGGGISLRLLQGESLYSPIRSSFELLAGCYRGNLVLQTGSPGFRGCRATAILRF